MATDKKINYNMQGNVRNYLGEQETVRVPKYWKSGEDHPKTELAYITKPELDLILKADFHGSLKDGPNVGPGGVMSLNDPGTGRTGAEMSQMEATGRDPGTGQVTQESSGIRAGFIGAGGRPTTRDEIQAYNRSQWDQRFTPYGQRTGGVGQQGQGFFKGIGGGIRNLMNRLRTVDGQVMPQSYFSEEERDKRRAQRSIDTILNRKAPVTNLTNKRLGQLYQTLDTPRDQRNFFTGAQEGQSPEMMNMTRDLGLYDEGITPGDAGVQVGADQNLRGTNVGNNEEFWGSSIDDTRRMINNSIAPDAQPEYNPWTDQWENGTSLRGDDDKIQRFSLADLGIQPNAANDFNTQMAKVYDKDALTGLGAEWAGYGFGANDQLEALENYYQEAQGLREGKLGKGKTPGQLRTWMERQQDIPFGGGLKSRDINMDLVPADFLVNEQDFIKQQSPYSLFGKSQGGRVGYNTGGRVGILSIF